MTAWPSYGLLHATNAGFQQTEVWSNNLNSAMIAMEIGAVVTFWIVFRPPQAYRRWVNGDHRFSTTPSS